MLALRDVEFGYPRAGRCVGPVTLTVEPGQAWAILGPNGAGKSTLLRLMIGLLRPRRGSVQLAGRPLLSLSPRARAQQLALIPQRLPAGVEDRVQDVVLAGRYPHRRFGLFESADDRAVVAAALRATATTELADRPLSTLSGGEAQRVHVAAALAQEPAVLLADEPTTALDLNHQLAVLRILQGRARAGQSVIVVTHDLNLAAQFCTHVLVLHEGGVAAQGPLGEVDWPGALERIYGLQLVPVLPPGARQPWLVPVLDPPEPRQPAGPEEPAS